MTTAQPLDVQPTPLALLLLGREADPRSERGVECPGDLPSPSDPDLVARARAAKEKLGDRVFVLGHHYQRDEVIQFADVTGDSFKLARDAAARPEAEYIVFCGVHFMAESADILTTDAQAVVLPDLAAGCSMADMATAEQVAECWDVLTEAGVADQVVPVSYMNSSADIKAFTGKHGGTICTSSNAKRALEWAFEQGEKILFLPDQHLGRNTAVRDMGLELKDCVLYNPHKPNGGLTAEQLRGGDRGVRRDRRTRLGRPGDRPAPGRRAERLPAALPRALARDRGGRAGDVAGRGSGGDARGGPYAARRGAAFVR
ncbi:Quinolinate synthase OS=Streptomyces microflavus OX=1919 GN=nadA PE=3 SV=1 [Streptomyces microflavus]